MLRCIGWTLPGNPWSASCWTDPQKGKTWVKYCPWALNKQSRAPASRSSESVTSLKFAIPDRPPGNSIEPAPVDVTAVIPRISGAPDPFSLHSRVDVVRGQPNARFIYNGRVALQVLVTHALKILSDCSLLHFHSSGLSWALVWSSKDRLLLCRLAV